MFARKQPSAVYVLSSLWFRLHLRESIAQVAFCKLLCVQLVETHALILVNLLALTPPSYPHSYSSLSFLCVEGCPQTREYSRPEIATFFLSGDGFFGPACSG